MHSQSPSSSVGLISALSTEDDQKSALQDSVWRVLDDTCNTLDKRCDFASELSQNGKSTSILKEGVLDHLALEATQALFNNQSADGESPRVRSFLSSCMGSSCESTCSHQIELTSKLDYREKQFKRYWHSSALPLRTWSMKSSLAGISVPICTLPSKSCTPTLSTIYRHLLPPIFTFPHSSAFTMPRHCLLV